jgi:hypothetical protein
MMVWDSWDVGRNVLGFEESKCLLIYFLGRLGI